jgi:hypothetical protein
MLSLSLINVLKLSSHKNLPARRMFITERVRHRRLNQIFCVNTCSANPFFPHLSLALSGGLIGLAASAIGLAPDIDKYLHLLILPVLDCFDDPESRVCYYACESMYNISKVARTGVLEYFNQIFDGLVKLFAHVDVDVKNGAMLLDRLIKDIVTETETFDIESFIPLLVLHMRRTKPYIRQLLRKCSSLYVIRRRIN